MNPSLLWHWNISVSHQASVFTLGTSLALNFVTFIFRESVYTCSSLSWSNLLQTEMLMVLRWQRAHALTCSALKMKQAFSVTSLALLWCHVRCYVWFCEKKKVHMRTGTVCVWCVSNLGGVQGEFPNFPVDSISFVIGWEAPRFACLLKAWRPLKWGRRGEGWNLRWAVHHGDRI